MKTKDSRLTIIPVFQRTCFAFIDRHHRHHRRPAGSIFQVGVAQEGRLVGVAVVGRPIARQLQDGRTAEVTRLCTDGAPNACSKLYAAAWRIASSMGYVRLVTYILSSEAGTSLRASGWTLVGLRGGGSWSCPSRKRIDKHPLEKKLRFERTLIKSEHSKPVTDKY